MVFNTGPYTDLPDNSILITANMQSETGFPSSHQLKSYVAYKSRLKLAARAVLSADAGLLVCPAESRRLSWPGWLGKIPRRFARPKTVTHPSISRGGRESNWRSSSCVFSALKTPRLPTYLRSRVSWSNRQPHHRCNHMYWTVHTVHLRLRLANRCTSRNLVKQRQTTIN